MQLLLTVQLRQTYKLHSIKLAAPSDGSAPSTVKLFINKVDMDFNDAEDLPPTQALELKGASATLPLQFTKFQSVNSVTVFLENNQGDTESTALSRLEVRRISARVSLLSWPDPHPPHPTDPLAPALTSRPRLPRSPPALASRPRLPPSPQLIGTPVETTNMNNLKKVG